MHLYICIPVCVYIHVRVCICILFRVRAFAYMCVCVCVLLLAGCVWGGKETSLEGRPTCDSLRGRNRREWVGWKRRGRMDAKQKG